MNRILTAAALALALSAPVAAHAACDITTIPVSQDEVKAAGLGRLMDQADKEMVIGTSEADKLIQGKIPITEQDERAMSTKLDAVRALYGKRMIVIAVAARCGAAAAEQAMRLRTGTEVTVPWYPLFNRMHGNY